jgi:hypothetical protein
VILQYDTIQKYTHHKIAHHAQTKHSTHTTQKSKAVPVMGRARPIGLWDVEDPTLSRQSAHRWQLSPWDPSKLMADSETPKFSHKVTVGGRCSETSRKNLLSSFAISRVILLIKRLLFPFIVESSSAFIPFLFCTGSPSSLAVSHRLEADLCCAVRPFRTACCCCCCLN